MFTETIIGRQEVPIEVSDDLLMVISDRPGFTPGIGRLVAMLTYSRHSVLAEVEGLSISQLDRLHDPESNSIGALLMHITGGERYYQRTLGIRDGEGTEAEEAVWGRRGEPR